LADLHLRIVDSMKFQLSDHAAQITNNFRNSFAAFSEQELNKKIDKLEQKILSLSKQVIKLQHENEKLRSELKTTTEVVEESKREGGQVTLITMRGVTLMVDLLPMWHGFKVFAATVMPQSFIITKE
jgi:benzoyl-CoA reductase/2-hydroxyglutaryl-CoA dehydratase subunit BcrC/BadD/HgdB